MRGPSNTVPPNVKDRPDLRYQDARQNQRVIDPGSLPGAQVPQALRRSPIGSGVSFVQFSFNVTANTVRQIAPQMLNRKYLLIQNNSGTNLFVGIGTEIDGTNGLLIPANGYYEPYTAPTNSIFVFSAVDSNGVFIQGN